MGSISKKLTTNFKTWGSQFRKDMAKARKSFYIPKTVHDLQPLVENGYDPLHAVYIAVQNTTSVFAECVSVLPELKAYCKVVTAAEDEYMPDGPPMSPLTRSFFTTWAFFDLRFGSDHETIGTCLLDLADQLGIDPSMAEAIRQFQQSRMGIYEHCGTAGKQIQFEELVTGRKLVGICSSGYTGNPGELWCVRLCPPLADLADYHVAVTTPYILTTATKTDWTAYLNRAMLNLEVQGEGQRLYELLKYGSWTHHWNEFVFLAFHHAQYDAIFLTGIPDVKGSLPHAKRGRK